MEGTTPKRKGRKPAPLVRVTCSCGERFDIPMSQGWTVNFIGGVEFTCPCGKTNGIKPIAGGGYARTAY